MINDVTPIEIPVTLYTLEDVRQQISDQCPHTYEIGTVRKAVREGKLKSLKVDGRTVVVTPEAVQEYIRKYCKYARSRTIPKKLGDKT